MVGHFLTNALLFLYKSTTAGDREYHKLASSNWYKKSFGSKGLSDNVTLNGTEFIDKPYNTKIRIFFFPIFMFLYDNYYAWGVALVKFYELFILRVSGLYFSHYDLRPNYR